jgi:hypothetical protein
MKKASPINKVWGISTPLIAGIDFFSPRTQ